MTIVHRYGTTEDLLVHLERQAIDQDLVAEAEDVHYKKARTAGYAEGLREAVRQFREARFDLHDEVETPDGNEPSPTDVSIAVHMANQTVKLEKLAARVRVVESRVGRIEHTLREEEADGD